MTPRRRLGEEPISLSYILFRSDISLSCFILGCVLVLWGLIAGFMAPSDIFTFTGDMQAFYPAFWVANYILVGIGFVWVTLASFPKTASVLLGGYGVVIWSWIAAYRGSANFTSGVALNVIVIVMSAILIHRSRRQ